MKLPKLPKLPKIAEIENRKPKTFNHRGHEGDPKAQPRAPQPQHAKTANAGRSTTERHRPNPQFKAQLFDTLHQLNRGYGIALAALTRLQKPGIFPRKCLRNYGNRTETLRAHANRDLLRLFAGREEQEAERFERLGSQPAKHRNRSNP